MVIEQGTTVGGFRVEGTLGRGGMATVYRAVQIRLHRPVALKILDPVLAADESFVQRFQIEGINAARLDHPNIVPVYEAGEDAGYAFMAMKLIDGESFGALIAREARITPPEAVRVLADVARALDHAHGLGFIHRDVKPGNILIDRTGHVFLSDFGLSKDMTARGITSTGQWMGTAEYMAPEQASGGPLDHRADLYALGCVAFECLTGDPPHLGGTPFAVMMAHANSPVPSAAERVPGLPNVVDRVLVRAMAKDPAARYASGVELVDDLSAACEGQEPAGAAAAPDPRPAPGRTPSWPTSAPPTPAPSMVCPHCIGMVERDDLFCGSCGSRLGWCASCDGPRLATDRFCPHCGATSAPQV